MNTGEELLAYQAFDDEVVARNRQIESHRDHLPASFLRRWLVFQQSWYLLWGRVRRGRIFTRLLGRLQSKRESFQTFDGWEDQIVS